MAEPYIGEIRMVGFTFAPEGWANADGQMLAPSEYSALYSLYGTTYGGDGRSTFGLPDLRGRVPIHCGQGPGLPSYQGPLSLVTTTRVLPSMARRLTAAMIWPTPQSNSATASP